MARERERVDLGPLMLTDLSDDGAKCLLEGLSLEFEIVILSYEADMSPSRGDAHLGSMHISSLIMWTVVRAECTGLILSQRC
ncbi:hypothetical protein CDL15_Pgr016357 [Punica granatum]|uniref:Uncharacterized protein n=1 Tax=Punica granatum TaxID=22663 RepID=A0A218W5L9_PUNGR|nr:hypothetical protein CDL15_Pgr016357 [Punica granatum]